MGSAVNMVVYGATAPFAAALMDRFGMRYVTTGALGLVGAGAVLTATAMTAAWQFTLYWGVLVGLGTGATAMAFAATVTERWFAARRGLVTGLLTAASVVGQFVFLPVLSEVVGRYGWRAAALTLAGAAVLTAPLVWLTLRDHPADVGQLPYGAVEFVPRPAPVAGAGRRAVRVLARSARTGPFWLLAGTFAICGASTNGVMWTHFAPAAHDHGMPMTAAASLLALIGIFNVAGTVASGWLTDRRDARRLLAAYFAVRGLALLALPLLLTATVQPPLVAFVVVFGLLDVATVPPTIALCRAHFGHDAAVVFGWVGAAHQVGAGAVAFLGGAARDAFGSYDLVWVGTAGLCATATLLSLATPGHRPAGPTPT
ncbi:MFS transporter [Streptomyces aureoverticillatus]|nr:MFS transporter [Streptomyces aureoverticillatus]